MIILLGKSCSGKTTIQNEISKLGMTKVVSYTTRPPRNGEKNGDTYNFISDREFFELYNEGFFIEKTSFKVNGGDVWHYGTAVKDMCQESVMIGNPQNVRILKKFESVKPFVVYIDTDEDVIYERMIIRKDNIGEVQRRMIKDREDFAGVESFINCKIQNNGLVEPREIAQQIKNLYEVHIGCYKK